MSIQHTRCSARCDTIRADRYIKTGSHICNCVCERVWPQSVYNRCPGCSICFACGGEFVPEQHVMNDSSELFDAVTMHPTSDIAQVHEYVLYHAQFRVTISVIMRDGSSIDFTTDGDGDNYIPEESSQRVSKSRMDAIWERVKGRNIKW